MKKRLIWFCVVQNHVYAGRTVLHETSNRMEAEEFSDILNTVETDIDTNYKVERRF